MIDLLYLKLSKEELLKAIHLYNNLSQENIYNMLIYIQRSMLFLIDSAHNRHVDIFFELHFLKSKAEKIFGNDFFENYFLITKLLRKDIKFLSKNKIIISGKSSNNTDSLFFKELLSKSINYFNKLYEAVENNEL